MNAGKSMGMGSQGMGTGKPNVVPPMKRYTCQDCMRPFLHRATPRVTCPHCRTEQDGQKTGMGK